jgi:O-succinylbenzoate synthase
MALLKIAAIEVDRFDIPFIRPMKVGNVSLHSREGFIVSLISEDGRTGFGEVAPLPGLDQTTLDLCRNDLSAMKKLLVGANLNPDLFDITAPWLGTMPLPHAFSAHTLFGVESALMSLYLQNRMKDGQTGALSLPDPLNVPVNGLFIPDSTDEEANLQMSTLHACGVKTVKVKIGRLPTDEEIRQILKLAGVIGKDLILRLDGNRMLSSQNYLRYFSALGHLNVEYVEEPLPDGQTISSDPVSWPIALDESLPAYLHSEARDPANLPPEVRSIILKPGFPSGLHGMAGCITEANARGIKTILSSSFNTGVTLSALALFSRMANLPPKIAQGFDTLRYLKTDVLSDSPVIREGFLTVSQKLLTGGMHLNPRVLTKENL